MFAAEPFGSAFWVTQAITLCLALALPWCRPGMALALAGGAAIGIYLLHADRSGPASIPLEFELLIVAVLLCIQLLMYALLLIRDRQQLTRLLSQYVPPELAALYTRDRQQLALGGEEREITVLFCDIVNFSACSEELEPQELAAWLNSFFTLAARIVVRHRGTIDKYMGDGIMAFWGAPAPSSTHAYDALAAALDLQYEVAALRARFDTEGHPPIYLGIGVASGAANVGILGSEYRRDYTVVGGTVNVARRIEAQTRKYSVPIIASDSTAEALPDMLFRELDTVMVKGRSQPVTMYQPLGLAATAEQRTIEYLHMHEAALAASRAGDWPQASALFARLRDEWGPPDMYELYLHGIATMTGGSHGSAYRSHD